MEKLCPCGCRRTISSGLRGLALTYVDATATRALTDRLWFLRLKMTTEADEDPLGAAQEKIDAVIEALTRALHRQSRSTDTTYIDRMRRPLAMLGQGLEAMDPECFRPSDSSRAS